MAYNYQFINYLYQYNLAQYTLIITDTDNVIPNYRVDKAFDIAENAVTDDYLAARASDEIQVMIDLYNQSQGNSSG